MAVHFIYSWPVVYAEKNDQQTRRRTEEQVERGGEREGDRQKGAVTQEEWDNQSANTAWPCRSCN